MSELQGLTPALRGTSTAPSLTSKAAETQGVLLYVHHMLTTKASKLEQGDLWVAACTDLVRMLQLMQDAPMVLETATVQEPREK